LLILCDAAKKCKLLSLIPNSRIPLSPDLEQRKKKTGKKDVILPGASPSQLAHSLGREELTSRKSSQRDICIGDHHGFSVQNVLSKSIIVMMTTLQSGRSRA